MLVVHLSIVVIILQCRRQVADAIRLLASKHHIIAEGAGAATVAAALAGYAGQGDIVCVVSGGNLDHGRLRTILAGETP